MLKKELQPYDQGINPAYEKSSYFVFFAWLLVFIFIYYGVSFIFSFSDYNDYSISITFFTLLLFIYNSKHSIAIKELIALIYTSQLLLGPVLSYIFLEFDYYRQPVEQETYFSFAVPAIVFFIMGIFFPLSSAKRKVISLNLIKAELQGKERTAYILIVIGFVSGFAKYFVPGGLAFFVFLLSNLKYIGALYLYFTNSATKSFVLAFIVGLLFLDAVASSMFHDFFLWLTFIVLFLAYVRKYNFFIKLSAIFMGFIFLFAIQAVKGEYRSAIWYGGQVEDNTGYFTSLIDAQLNSEAGLFSDNNIKRFIYRINQGWIVAHTMNHTPAVEPFADGETIVRGVTSTVLPRFLNTDKYVAGGKEYFERFSGLVLVGSTSMNLSSLGEAYANFGVGGGIIFMFFFGLIINFSFHSIMTIAQTRPTVILWLPLIFLQVVKAETDFTTVFNHLVKAAFVTWLLYWSFQKFFKIRL
ncbi:hypothetical protein GCM10027443_13930 [Pontibacter brevis]